MVDEVEVAVGYAPTYYTFTSSVNEAFDDAARRLWRDRVCRVQSVEAYGGVGEERMFMGRIYRISYPEEGFDAFKKSLVVVDTFSVPQLTIVLVATKPITVDKNLALPPDMDSNLAQGDDPRKGLGIAQLYYQWASSFREAEELARIDLAYSTFVKRRGIDLSIPQNTASVSEVQTDIILNKVRTVRRRLSLSYPPYVQVTVQSQSFSLPQGK